MTPASHLTSAPSDRVPDAGQPVATKACPVVLRTMRGTVQCLAFRHPEAGHQLVKGSIETGEAYADAAIRELREESGICHARAVKDLGLWSAGFAGQVWTFQLCEISGTLPEAWTFRTGDDGGHDFSFFWHPLALDLPEPCHWLFQAALQRIRSMA